MLLVWSKVSVCLFVELFLSTGVLWVIGVRLHISILILIILLSLIDIVYCIIKASVNWKLVSAPEYLNGEVASDYDEENPLTYWVTVQHRVPLLAKLARHVLCCPATSAQSERDFSHTGLILTARRSLLSPKYVSSLEFLAAAHRAGLGSF